MAKSTEQLLEDVLVKLDEIISKQDLNLDKLEEIRISVRTCWQKMVQISEKT